MNLHDSPFNNGLLFFNFNQDFGEFRGENSRIIKSASLLLYQSCIGIKKYLVRVDNDDEGI
jgi:hypothetical protein